MEWRSRTSIMHGRWTPRRAPVGVGAGLLGAAPGLSLPPLPNLSSFNPVQTGLDWAQQNVVEPVSQMLTPVQPQGQTRPFGAGLTLPGQQPAEKSYGPLTPLNKSIVQPIYPQAEDGSVTYHAQRASDITEGREQTPGLANDQEGDLVSGFEEFGNAHLEALFNAAGLGGATAAACGPIAIAGMLRAFGIDVDPASVAKRGQDANQWSGSIGMLAGDGSAASKLLGSYNVKNTLVRPDWSGLQNTINLVQRGTPVILNFPNHYMLAQDYDPQTGKFFVGATGSNALKDGSDWMTLAEMNAHPGNGGSLRAIIAPSQAPESVVDSRSKQRFTPTAASPRASQQEISAYITQAARARGIDPSVALRIAQSEGGLDPARHGDFATGDSWWPFQLHYGGAGYEQYGTTAGMGNAFTQQTGYQPGDPAAWKASVDYALDAAAKARSWGAWYGRGPAGVGINEGFS